LKEDQINQMTKYLISMKSEYDMLVRESTQIKENTDKIGVILWFNSKRQIQLMDKIDLKTNLNFNKQKEILEEIKNQIALKRAKLEEQQYQKTTFTNLITKMQDDILITKMQINNHSRISDQSARKIAIQKCSQTSIKEKWNNMHSEMLRANSKILINQREHEYQSQYNSTVFSQKAAFQSLMYLLFF